MDPTTARLAALLAPRFTVTHYDRRGRGDSGDTEPYAVEREVEDLEALVEEAGGSALLYGMSSGGALALEAGARGVAATKPALYEPPFMVGDDGARAPEDFATRLSELTASGRRGDAVELFLSEGPGVPADVIAQMRSEPIWPATAVDANRGADARRQASVCAAPHPGRPDAPGRAGGTRAGAGGVFRRLGRQPRLTASRPSC
jgi:pimeloyl-ACP methyl ester carboxylesterase